MMAAAAADSGGDSFDWKAAKAEWHKIACELWENAPKIYKNFYKEHPDVTRMSDEDVKNFRLQANNIMVFADGNEPLPLSQIPRPCVTFEHAFYEHPLILQEIRRQGFPAPSPIQSQIWPVALSGHDAIAIAQTGTGKTLGFLFPAFIHLENQTTFKENPDKPLALVMCPTRELALQTEKEFNKYSYKGFKAVCVYGGAPKREQIQQIRDGCQFIIATPGRLADICSENVIDLTLVSFVVLDEADRMLDLGFEPQIIRILSQMRPDRQTFLTSATWPTDIQRLSSKYLCNPVKIQIGTLELSSSKNVQQIFHFLPEYEKRDAILDLISKNPREKVIIFINRKAVCSHLSSDMLGMGISCASIHGDMSQEARISSLEEFKRNECTILVATDVAARGIDVADVTLVVNYDMPKTAEDYVHRVGRTGRAGKQGSAISFFTKPDSRLAADIINILKQAGQEVPDLLHKYRENEIIRNEQRQAEGGFRGGRGGGFGGRGGGGGGYRGGNDRGSYGGGNSGGYGQERGNSGGYRGGNDRGSYGGGNSGGYGQDRGSYSRDNNESYQRQRTYDQNSNDYQGHQNQPQSYNNNRQNQYQQRDENQGGAGGDMAW